MTDTDVEYAPGIHDITEAEYRSSTALSCSEARRILECPAKYRWDRQNGEQHAGHYDVGKAAHAVILGVGNPVRVVEADSWRTNAAKAERLEAYEAGEIPVLAAEWAVISAMAAMLLADPRAAALLNPEHGAAERSLFWRDPRTGVLLRCRVDWLPEPPERGRLIVSDYKTAQHADRRSFARSAAAFGYHQQDAWYLDGVATVLEVDDPAFVFIVQEKDPPYLVNVIELDPDARAIGRDRNRRAIDLFVECSRTGIWPGYGPEVEQVSLPRWAGIQHDEDVEQWSADEDGAPW